MLLNIRDVDGPLHRRIYDALKSTILGGQLGPGARLPSSRALAADLAVSRNTVSLAYEQLAAEGYVVPRQRAVMVVANGAPTCAVPNPTKTRVKARVRISSYGQRLAEDARMVSSGSYVVRPGMHYNFRYGRPAVDEFPHKVWRQLLAARARRASRDAFGYGPPAGYEPLREALVGYLLRARGLSCTSDQIVIVNGSQQAFDLIARVLIDPGDNVVIEEPHYHGSRITLNAAGAQLIPIPVDAEGLDTRRLPSAAACVRLACVTPCHQFPTGVIMSLGRRLALLDWASRVGAWVVEDDYVSEFRYEGHPIEPLQSLDRAGQVMYVGTFSKILFPALRIAYLVLPPMLVRPFLAAKWAADRYTTLLGQEALTDFIASGQFERYLRRARTRNAARRQTLIEALHRHLGDSVEIAGENAGVHLLVWLNDVAPRDLDSIIARAASAGVGVYSVAPYYTRPPRRAGLLLGYASLPETAIRAGVRRFAEVLRA